MIIVSERYLKRNKTIMVLASRSDMQPVGAKVRVKVLPRKWPKKRAKFIKGVVTKRDIEQLPKWFEVEILEKSK